MIQIICSCGERLEFIEVHEILMHMSNVKVSNVQEEFKRICPTCSRYFCLGTFK